MMKDMSRIRYVVGIGACLVVGWAGGVGCSGGTEQEAAEQVEEGGRYVVEAGEPFEEVVAGMYAQAIEDFVVRARQEYGVRWDTLTFGKIDFGEPGDFPDIELPDKIAGTAIRLVSMQEAEAIQRAQPASWYVNLIGPVHKDGAKFIFVVFSRGFAHQFDGFLDYAATADGYRLEQVRFEDFALRR